MDFRISPAQHSAATASLNVNAACAVVLHHFATWASIPEADRAGFKFTTAAPESSVANSGVGIKQMRTLNADGSAQDLALRGGASESGESGSEGSINHGLDFS